MNKVGASGYVSSIQLVAAHRSVGSVNDKHNVYTIASLLREAFWLSVAYATDISLTGAQVFSVRVPPYNGRDIETSLRRLVHVWKRWREIFLPIMDGRLIAALLLHRRSLSSTVLAFYSMLS